MSFDIEALLAQAEQVDKQAKERKTTVIDRPLYDIQIPKWGQSKQFKYQIGEDQIAGKKMLAVVVAAHNGFLRWGAKSHDAKKGPFCATRGYHDPVSGEVVNKSHWEIPRPSVDMTITAYRPFGSRKDPDDESKQLDCGKCRQLGLNKSEEQTKFGGEDKCDNDAYLEVVVFRHMVEREDGNIYETVNKGSFGKAYMAKLPITSMTQGAFMNFTFDLARSRKMHYSQVLVEIKIEEEKIRSGAMVAKLDFREMDPSKPAYQEAVAEAHKIFTQKKEDAKAEYAKKKGNPVSQSSGGSEAPFSSSASY